MGHMHLKKEQYGRTRATLYEHFFFKMQAVEITLEDFVIVFCATGMAAIRLNKALHKSLMVNFEILNYFSSNYFHGWNAKYCNSCA